ncbi:MAG: hypothetical protein AAFP70_02060 [Calditrichota bacterium]
MRNFCTTGLFLMLFSGSPLFSQEPPIPWESTTWDTIAVNISIIEALVAADSLKNGLMKQLFNRHNISAEHYCNFHAHITTQPGEVQKEFFSRVKEILQLYIREKHFENFPEPLILPDSINTSLQPPDKSN